MKRIIKKLNHTHVIMALVILLSALLIASTGIILATERTYIPMVQIAEATATPTPMPAGTLWLIVKPDQDKGWALARFAKSYNKAGRPIMEIYPGDSKPVSERIKILKGERVLAYDTIVLADGGGKYWKLVEIEAPDGTVLYLRKLDVVKESEHLNLLLGE